MLNKLKAKIATVNKGTIIRTVTLILAIINQIIAVVGRTTFASAMWYQIISIAATGIAALVAAWENNDWTYFARLGTGVLDALEDGKLTAEEVKEILNKASGKTGKGEWD